MTAPLVVKLGGRALAAAGAGRELAAALAGAARPVALVHGGGDEVSDWSRRLGIEPRFHGGRRVTDPETLAVAAAILAGLANKRLVAALRAHGVDAVGLSLADGVLEVAPAGDPGLGAVGRPLAGPSPLLDGLLAAGRVPVVASVGAAGGGLLNVNADDAAAALASGLGAVALVLLSDIPGLELDGATVARLDGAAVADALAHPDVTGGMRPKLEAARAALDGGTARVAIAAWQGPGTLAGLLAGRLPCTWIGGSTPAEVAHG